MVVTVGAVVLAPLHVLVSAHVDYVDRVEEEEEMVGALVSAVPPLLQAMSVVEVALVAVPLLRWILTVVVVVAVLVAASAHAVVVMMGVVYAVLLLLWTVVTEGVVAVAVDVSDRVVVEVRAEVMEAACAAPHRR